MRTLAKAVAGAGLAICAILWGLFALGGWITRLLGWPAAVSPPLGVRLLGGAAALAGVALVLWLLRYRRPAVMIVSTHFTFVRMLTGRRGTARPEPLVVRGPQRYVRHPLYLGATAVFLGWALVTGDPGSMLGAVLVLLWLRLVQIPFEERELRDLFGEAYVRYAREVPMLIPRWRARWRCHGTADNPRPIPYGAWPAASGMGEHRAAGGDPARRTPCRPSGCPRRRF